MQLLPGLWMQSTNWQRALESRFCNKTLKLGTCKESPMPAGKERAFPDILLLIPRSSRDGNLSKQLSRSRTSSLGLEPDLPRPTRGCNPVGLHTARGVLLPPSSSQILHPPVGYWREDQVVGRYTVYMYKITNEQQKKYPNT